MDEINYDVVLYIANADRAGLYSIEHIKNSDDCYFRCVAGDALNEESAFAEFFCGDFNSLSRLVHSSGYVPLYSEKEALAYRLKYGF